MGAILILFFLPVDTGNKYGEGERGRVTPPLCASTDDRCMQSGSFEKRQLLPWITGAEHWSIEGVCVDWHEMIYSDCGFAALNTSFVWQASRRYYWMMRFPGGYFSVGQANSMLAV